MTQDEAAARYFVGLDLGQAADYSALAVLQADGEDPDEWRWTARHLHRWPLGTSYPQIVADTVALCAREPLTLWTWTTTTPDPYQYPRRVAQRVRTISKRPTLVIDGTGVGRPVVDLFRESEELKAEVYAVTITGGDSETHEGGTYRVPKRDLVSRVQVLLQTERLKIAAGMREAETLRRELQNFRTKISLATGHDSYEAWRESDHDDLVLAVCLAVWGGRHSGAAFKWRLIGDTLNTWFGDNGW